MARNRQVRSILPCSLNATETIVDPSYDRSVLRPDPGERKGLMTKASQAKTGKTIKALPDAKNFPEDRNRAEKAWAEFLDRLVHDLREPL
jgi:hypothetical protein